MSSSSSHPQTSPVEELVSALTEEGLRTAIDLTIDRATKGFSWAWSKDTSPSAKELITAAGALIQRIYRYGIRPPRHLTRDQAVAEAIQIIEDDYRSVLCRGFSAFILDGRGVDPGPDAVLGALAAIVKARERERHKTLLVAAALDPLNWDERVRAAAQLRSLLSEHLPEEVRSQSAGILASVLPRLLDLRLGVIDEISRMASAFGADGTGQRPAGAISDDPGSPSLRVDPTTEEKTQ